MKRILVATDLSARSDRAVARAVRLAGELSAHLTVLHVVDEDLPRDAASAQSTAAEREIKSAIAAMPEAAKAITDIRIAPGRDYVDILRNADADDADLIVVGLHRNSRGPRPLFGTTVERVIREGVLPTLVVRDRADAAYQTALVGVDFSIYARRALELAMRVAPKAHIHAVHAYHVPFEGFLAASQDDDAVRGEHEKRLAAMIEAEMAALLTYAGAKDRADIKISSVCRRGDVRKVLRDAAAEIKPQLMVLGTHGRVGLMHALLGSVAEDFLNDPPCDVLAVKAW